MTAGVAELVGVGGSFYDVLAEFRALSTSEADKGSRFERLVQSYLRLDPVWVDQFDEVWLWGEWPGNNGKHDTGIDLVARARGTGGLTAIQAKFYAETTTVSKEHIDTFLSASGKTGFTARLVVTTTTKWTSHAEDAIKGQQVPVRRIGPGDLAAAPIDWSRFSVERPDVLVTTAKKDLRPHQRDAIAAAEAGLATSDRGKLVMACGTGKTLTALRLAERLAGTGGTVLFLVPSIALLSQSLREWVNDAEVPLTPLAVCSDPHVSRTEDISTVDLALPASTDAAVIGSRLALALSAGDRMTVVFATYQSIAVVSEAQSSGAVSAFDLILCDEAHRTTGVTLTGEDESAFVKVHDPDFIRASRRVYLTATPRIYNDSTKARAGEKAAVLASMDDEALFGPEFYRLGFGEAVSRGLLSDYKVLVLAVDEGSVARTFQMQLADENNELQLNDYAKIIGCWNGLAKRGETEHTFADDPTQMRRAVAFAGHIRDSQAIERLFPTVIDTYIDAHDLDGTTGDDEATTAEAVLRADVHHVDGTMSALVRNGHIDWLKQGEAGTARILTNARCLSEGVDVPALDAVLFLSPRKSVVDVVQSVGRVMRQAPGKRYGYIILPIGIPAGMEPDEALADNTRYKVVWDVLQALRAHDERFDAMVNRIELNKARSDRINIIGVRDTTDSTPGDPTTTTQPGPGIQGELPLTWPELDNWRDAIYARIVAKVGSRRYWETWAGDIADIAATHVTRISSLLASDHGGVRAQFETFLAGLRGNLNDNITQADAIEMLAQHLITRPVFDALFEGYAFAEHNPVAQAMQAMLDVLDEQQLDDENASLEKFYDSVRTRAAGIDNAEGRQRIIVELYDTFFKRAFPRTVDKLGIVYTPIEVVDFILASADWALREEFGQGLTDEGVHILDGFTGTGTFIVRLLQSGLVTAHDLARKFTSELHANEFLLLAYYIAAVNIETAFHDAAKATDPAAAYQPFPGLVLTDTFQSYEDGDTADLFVLPANNERIERQRGLDIRVCVGNPPYSSGQDSANDNNANEKYPQLDAAIRTTYAETSSATNKNSLYDSYIRAIKWASLRIKDRGVVAFVTNGGWLDSNTADGMRKALVEEFTSIYVYNLRGNQRTAGEESRREGGKIFDAGSRATVAVFLLVKNPDRAGPATIHYADIGDYLTREEKLRVIRETGSMAGLTTRVVVPNAAGDWLNQRSDDFAHFMSLAPGLKVGVFGLASNGPTTSRDAWLYNSSRRQVTANVELTLASFHRARAGAEISDPTRISWSRGLRTRAGRGDQLRFEPSALRQSMYRPFFRQVLYFSPDLNEVQSRSRQLFPTASTTNVCIYQVGSGSAVPFSVLITSHLPDLHLTGAGSAGQVFARHRYEPIDSGQPDLLAACQSDAGSETVGGYRRIDNITDSALSKFQAAYGANVTKDDIFFYCYGLLHSPDYRTRYAADLKKVLPHIPLVADAQPFITAGRELAELHLNYETASPHPLGGLEDLFGVSNPPTERDYERFRVEKMQWRKVRGADKKLHPDKTTLLYNSAITLTGIPAEAHRYMVGAKSALDWIVERYAVKKDRDSGIVNDPNDWSREVGNPRYIVDLVARIVTVSLKTIEIVDALPTLTVRGGRE